VDDNQRNISPTTTSEQDLVTLGQRNINLMWETTQRYIAVIVVTTTVGTAAVKALFDMVHNAGTVTAGPAFIFLVGAANLVVGFYFGRTNHTRPNVNIGAQDG
jgi:hypothetical protein